MAEVARMRHGSSIGQPLTRRDGVLKVTGGPATPPTTIRRDFCTPCWRPPASPAAASPFSTSRRRARIPAWWR
jgi:hypothetical protein